MIIALAHIQRMGHATCMRIPKPGRFWKTMQAQGLRVDKGELAHDTHIVGNVYTVHRACSPALFVHALQPWGSVAFLTIVTLLLCYIVALKPLSGLCRFQILLCCSSNMGNGGER